MLIREAFKMPVQYLDAAVEASAIVLLRAELLNRKNNLRRRVIRPSSSQDAAPRSV